MGRQGMTDDEQKALDKFIREQHAKKGNDFKDDPRSTGDLNNVRDHLVAKKEKIEAAISAIDSAILAAEGLF